MALPSGNVTKFVWSGSVNGTDRWSVGVWYSHSAAPSQTQLDTACSDARGSFQNSFWGPASNAYKLANSTVTTYDKCNAYFYSAGVLTRQSESTATAVAGTGSQTLPSYTAMCVTLRTASFGRSYRGRIYLPHTGLNLTANLRLNTQQPWLDNLATVIGGVLNSAAAYQGVPAVVSQTRGVATPITSLKLDNLPDTQRGRQSDLPVTSTLTKAVVVG